MADAPARRPGCLHTHFARMILAFAKRQGFSPIALRVPLHDADPLPDHEHAGGLLRDPGRECGAGQGERAADRQRFFALHAVVRLGD